MADEHDSGIDLPPQHLQEVEDLACHRGVETGGRLVEDEQPRTRRERRGDADPLLLPTRQLVRPPSRDHGRLRQAHRRQQLQGPQASRGAWQPLQPAGFGHLRADADRRVQAACGALVDHGERGGPPPPPVPF